jgi:hypothetical protein
MVMTPPASGGERGALIKEYRTRLITSGEQSPFVTVIAVAIVVVLLLALWPVSHAGALSLTLVIGAVWFTAFRRLKSMGVAAYERGLLVRGLFGQRWIPWGKVAEFRTPGDLQIVLNDGHVVLAASVTSANFGWLTGKRGEADAVADELRSIRESWRAQLDTTIDGA